MPLYNMLKSLTLKNFTVFADVHIEFSSGLNVIIGDNASGKTHLLKLGYSVMHTLSRKEKLINAKKTLADKLYQVFKTNSLGHITRHDCGFMQSPELTFAQKITFRTQ